MPSRLLDFKIKEHYLRLLRKVVMMFIIVLFINTNNLFAQKRSNVKIANSSFELEVSVNLGDINIKIIDLKNNIIWADGEYQYMMSEMSEGELTEYSGLEQPTLELHHDRIRIRGIIDAFELKHDFIVSADSQFFAEKMDIMNTRGVKRNIQKFVSSFSKKILNNENQILSRHANDRFQAVPFLHRSDDTISYNQHDYSIQKIMGGKGFKYYATEKYWSSNRRQDSENFISEGWGWRHDDAILGIFSFNQDNMIYSTVSYNKAGFINFGGFTKEGLNLSSMERFEPNSTLYLGMNRFYSISGDYNQIAYKYRDMLDELGCRFPDNYNPPLHWNQLYSSSMYGTWKGDRKLYSIDNLLMEAQKARDYSCQALYLDPGWDTKFGSFLWASDRLGDAKEYVKIIKNEYGLETSLHTPLAPWATNEKYLMGPSPVNTWPSSSKRMIKVLDEAEASGNENIEPAKIGPQICFGSIQYLDEAEKRMLELCDAGVSFLMFDGPHWNGPCLDSNHGHSLPFVYEDQVDACVDLIRRVHRKYPDVSIEMHDMVNGGGQSKTVPVYYKYGLPGSWDENWGFELMWKPFSHLKDKTALALYYYNLGTNIPLYLHVDIGQDNSNALLLWWYASTCRHLGIGVSGSDPVLAKLHKAELKKYIELQDFFKRGDFYGINEEIHIHSIKEKQECVINIFNLSDKPAIKEGSISLTEIGLDPKKEYSANKDWIKIENGIISIHKKLKAWDTDLTVIKSLN